MNILNFLILVISIILLSFLIMFKDKLKNFLIIGLVLFLIVSIIIYPKDSVDAALKGVEIWIFVIIPSLLPFIVGADLLIKLGLVDFVGVLLEPIMYPLFKVSGKGSFVFAMSVTSGYPVGANLISNLRKENSITKVEAQRLISFCSTSGPLFVIATVSVGMLQNAETGPLLLISHYLGAISVGFIFRFYSSDNSIQLSSVKTNYLKKCLNTLFSFKDRKFKPLTILINNSITSSFNSIVIVGGFIIIYSVVIKILSITNVTNYVSNFLISVLPINLDFSLLNSFLSGLIELTNGCQGVSNLSLDIIVKLCAISFLIGWGGLSVHSQAMSFLSDIDISKSLYLVSKVLHGIFSSIYTYLFYILFFKNKIDSVSASTIPATSIHLTDFLSTLKFSTKLMITVAVTTIILSLIYGLFYNIKLHINRQL